jgi:hypothetical protein
MGHQRRRAGAIKCAAAQRKCVKRPGTTKLGTRCNSNFELQQTVGSHAPPPEQQRWRPPAHCTCSCESCSFTAAVKAAQVSSLAASVGMPARRWSCNRCELRGNVVKWSIKRMSVAEQTRSLFMLDQLINKAGTRHVGGLSGSALRHAETNPPCEVAPCWHPGPPSLHPPAPVWLAARPGTRLAALVTPCRWMEVL